MKKIIFTFLAATAILISSCGKHSGFKKTDSGVYYKFYTENDTLPTAKIGDVILFHAMYYVNDSLVMDTKQQTTEPIPMLLQEPVYKGDFFECLAMMHKGDSAAFILNADTFFLKQPGVTALPEWVKPQSELKIVVRVVDVKNRAQYESEQNAAYSDMQQKEHVKIAEYIKTNNLKADSTSSGLYVVEVKKGNGKQAATGKTVNVHYTGKFTDGKVFDSSVERGKPIEIVLGQGMVIPGWDEGIALLKEGGKSTLIIPWWLAYGSQGNQVIPPFTTLVFDVELISVK